VKAIFLNSLGSDSEEDNNENSGDENDNSEDDEVGKRRKEVKLQKSLRNQVNREKNREKREQEAKILEAYMPADQRGKPLQGCSILSYLFCIFLANSLLFFLFSKILLIIQRKEINFGQAMIENLCDRVEILVAKKTNFKRGHRNESSVMYLKALNR
jgi:hypothetical protein